MLTALPASAAEINVLRHGFVTEDQTKPAAGRYGGERLLLLRRFDILPVKIIFRASNTGAPGKP